MADLSKDTLLFAREKRRMCKYFLTDGECEKCGLYNLSCEIGDCFWGIGMDDDILQYVQQWHDEHPPKTYAQDFREKFPNCAWRDDENRPRLCRYAIYHSEVCCTRSGKCAECWNETMPEE